MKLIILGMDNTGKTTLCKKIKFFLNYEWIKSLGPGKSKEEVEDFIKENMSKSNIIFERFSPLEEVVYGNILRNYSEFEIEDEIINNLKTDKEVLIIYCRPSEERIFDFGIREQMSGVIEEKEKLLNKWDEIYIYLLKNNFNIIKYNFDEDNLFEIFDKIKKGEF